ncbi:MAG: hypothetical protein AAFR05_07235 [Bacteroidota bacterium]
MNKKACPICAKPIVGRSDKKFCSLACKNKFHHPAQNQQGNLVKTVNRFLLQNFQIMEGIFREEKKNKLMIPRMVLDQMGFHFNYCTGCYLNRQGKLYHYVYNYAWMAFSNQELMLLRQRKSP